MAIYDKTNNRHRAWYSGLSEIARPFILEFLQSQRSRSAGVKQIRAAFKSKYRDRCKKSILRSEANRQPKWEHCIDNALQILQKKGAVYYENRRRQWCLRNATLTTVPDYEVTRTSSTRSKGPILGGGLPSLGKRR